MQRLGQLPREGELGLPRAGGGVGAALAAAPTLIANPLFLAGAALVLFWLARGHKLLK